MEFEDQSPVASEWMKRTGVSHKLERLTSQADAVREIKQAIVNPTMTQKVNIFAEPFLRSCLNLGPAAEDPISSFDKKHSFDTVSAAEISKLVGYVARQRGDLTKTIDTLLDDLFPVYEKWTQVFSSVKY
ncbi:MAG TPA: hypothetical protein VLJ79_30070 [Candidatus Binatia bacterium]|nr:hypothetical protein [Candidatus Binatia bacterium]